MTQIPRWLPRGRHLVEVTTRTFQGRYLLKPTPKVREMVLGVIGRAQRIHGMTICLLVFMSNHYHMLLVPEDSEQLARFMNFVNGEIAKEINRRSGWRGKVWGRRFDPILVTDEPAVERKRFRYLLSHGVKEGLVDRPYRWVGAHGVDYWLHGKPLRGYWFDRDRETRARRRAEARGERVDPMDFAIQEVVELTPLPCWIREGLDDRAIRREIEAMVEDVVEAARAERVLARKPGRADYSSSLATLLDRPWDFRPSTMKHSPCPRFHFESRAAVEALREALGQFLEQYREASARLRAGPRSRPGQSRIGDRIVRFPDGCFPPGGPFTGFVEGPPGREK